MTVTVRIPSAFHRLTGGLNVIEAQDGTIGEMLEDLAIRFPYLKDQLCDANGAVRPSIHIYVGGEDIRFLDGLQTRLDDQAIVSIFPAIAGGNS